MLLYFYKNFFMREQQEHSSRLGFCSLCLKHLASKVKIPFYPVSLSLGIFCCMTPHRSLKQSIHIHGIVPHLSSLNSSLPFIHLLIFQQGYFQSKIWKRHTIPEARCLDRGLHEDLPLCLIDITAVLVTQTFSHLIHNQLCIFALVAMLLHPCINLFRAHTLNKTTASERMPSRHHARQYKAKMRVMQSVSRATGSGLPQMDHHEKLPYASPHTSQSQLGIILQRDHHPHESFGFQP